MTPNNPSKPVPLEAEVVEAAAKAYLSHPGLTDERIEAAVLAADEARGMRVEDRLKSEYPESERRKAQGGRVTVREQRIVSDWFPIKGSVDD